MIASSDTARVEWPCPVARLWGKANVSAKCRGDACPVWRWIPLDAVDSRFVSAIWAEQERLAQAAGKANNGGFAKKATANVMKDRAAHGLPDRPERGYCGLGGKPQV